MMASAQVVETSVNTNNSPSQDYTTNLDNHSNHSIDSPGFKPFTVITITLFNLISVISSASSWVEVEEDWNWLAKYLLETLGKLLTTC